MEDHGVIRCNVANSGTDSEHGSRSFVAEQMGKEPVLALHTVDLTQLRSTDAAVVDLDQYLPHAQCLGKFDLSDHQRLVLFDQDRSLRGSRQFWHGCSTQSR